MKVAGGNAFRAMKMFLDKAWALRASVSNMAKSDGQIVIEKYELKEASAEG